MSARELDLPDALFERYADCQWQCSELLDPSPHANPSGTTANTHAVSADPYPNSYVDSSHPHRDLAAWRNSIPDCHCFDGLRRDHYPAERSGPGHDRDAGAGRTMDANSDVHPAELGSGDGLRSAERGSRSEVSGDDRGGTVSEVLDIATWYSHERGHVITACPECGKEGTLAKGTHTVESDGRVSPSYICPLCHWHGWVRLIGWEKR